MSTTIVNIIDMKDGKRICDLKYGTFVTGVMGHPDSFYVKIDKRKCGDGVSVNFSPHKCVLVNVKTGTLREIPGDSLVRVLDAEINVSYVTESWYNYLKK